MDMAWNTKPYLMPRLKMSATMRQIPFYTPIPYYRATFTFTLYFSRNIIRSDQMKDDMGYAEREEDAKMLWKSCKKNIIYLGRPSRKLEEVK